MGREKISSSIVVLVVTNTALDGHTFFQRAFVHNSDLQNLGMNRFGGQLNGTTLTLSLSFRLEPQNFVQIVFNK